MDMSEALKVGDLVRVLEGTHDSYLPPSRTGLIVEVISDHPANPSFNGVYGVQFGREILRFHYMFLQKLS